MSEQLKQEAARCLMCKKAKCSAACPVSTKVPECIKLYKEGRLEEVGKILFENNPFSIITSRVCDWNKLCYGNCVLNFKKQAVKWYEIEQFISKEYLFNYHPETIENKNQKIAILGAGPAGITAAIRLREKGYQVSIYDDKPSLGGVLKYGIPEFRLDTDLVNEYERIVNEYGIKFIPNVLVGKDLDFRELRLNHDAVVVATGAGIPRKLRIPGEENNPKVIYALNYLEHPENYSLGKKVLVIGGGNVTMDASRTAARKGCDTYVYYRKTFENMPANANEIEDAKKDGVKFVVFEVPVAIKDGNKAIMRKCENYEREDGSIGTKMLEGTDYEVLFDNMIVAISGNIDYSIFGDDAPEYDEKGWPIINEYQQTSFENVFLAGDFVSGPKTVVDAVRSANIVTEGIVKLLEK